MATPNIVPRADNEGSLGVSAKQWADIQAKKFNGKAQASTNTANTVVIRDASGNFSAGTITATLTGNVTGNVTGSSGSCTGNAATATKLATARTISLTGDVTGSASFDGSGNASITATVADDSHNHTIANVDSLQTTLDGKAASSHTHSYLELAGGTMTGVLTAQNNTSYTTKQVRNITLSTADPSGGANGDVWIKYTA